MTKEGANANSSVKTGNILISGKEALTLIDTCATHSFISEVYMHSLSGEPSVMHLHFNILLPSGDEIWQTCIFKACPVQMDTRLLFSDLIVIPLVAFDVILTVKFLSDDRESEMFVGLGSSLSNSIISCLQATKLLYKGCIGFLASLLDVRKESNMQLQDIDAVQDYPDLFAEEVSRLPPDREVKFVIELIPGTAPISKASYRMAPTEMKELKNQLRELLDKGFIRPSSSPWRAPVYL
ncbi:uncharacterized protein LOC142538704 [Primulina tabacum]|uniref:uncharacterized protein LOC142538704 n=1 Tax=Primulina tabacum TaxID=48773 RepID=UPI003F5A5507